MEKERRITRSSTFRWVSSKVAPPPAPNTAAIGVISFEITALMSKLVQIWNQLQDNEFTTAKQNLSNSTGIKNLISNDEQFLTELFMREIVEELQYIAKSIVRFGSKCTDPVIHEFEKFVENPLKNEFEWFGWQYKWKKMDRRVRKMQRFVALTAELATEMEILAAVERNMRRTTASFFSGKSLKHQKKITWHRRQVQSLKLITPWNRSFDYIVRLFMRSIITIVERIKIVFGVNELRRPEENEENSGGRRVPAANFRRSEFEEQGKKQSPPPLMKISGESKKFSQFSRFPSFRDCKHGGIGHRNPLPALRKTSSLKNRDETRVENRALSSPKRINGGHYSISSFFSKENLQNPLPNSLSAAALAIHYGKIVISIEKFASAPQLIEITDREKLFNLLPASIRTALRSRLKPAAKLWQPPLYHPVLAAEWKSAMAKILQWLAPMAHDMEAWHSEQSIEKQPDGAGPGPGPGNGFSSSHVLLLQTLHYADREKTEAAIVELIVALSNICNSSEVYEKRLSKPMGVENHRSYFCMNDDFSYFEVCNL